MERDAVLAPTQQGVRLMVIGEVVTLWWKARYQLIKHKAKRKDSRFLEEHNRNKRQQPTRTEAGVGGFTFPVFKKSWGGEEEEEPSAPFGGRVWVLDFTSSCATFHKWTDSALFFLHPPPSPQAENSTSKKQPSRRTS